MPPPPSPCPPPEKKYLVKYRGTILLLQGHTEDEKKEKEEMK